MARDAPAPTIVHKPSRHLVGATSYTFPFRSSLLGGTTAFRFWAFVQTRYQGDLSDCAPNGQCGRRGPDQYYYDLPSR